MVDSNVKLAQLLNPSRELTLEILKIEEPYQAIVFCPL